MIRRLQNTLVATVATITLCACAVPEPQPQPQPQPQPALPVAVVDPPQVVVVPPAQPVAARLRLHGVIKMLETQGIRPEIVVGTSAASVVGALYAGGYRGFEL